METSGGIQASLAGRYASALFGLARDERQIDAVGRSLDALASALADSREFAELVASPLVSRKDAAKAFAALGPRARRSIRLPPISSACSPATAARASCARSSARIKRIAAEHRGEISADVTTAHPLKDDQVDALKAQLKSAPAATSRIDAQVDPNILGGIVIKLGSEMIDASIRTKLNNSRRRCGASAAAAMKG